MGSFVSANFIVSFRTHRIRAVEVQGRVPFIEHTLHYARTTNERASELHAV